MTSPMKKILSTLLILSLASVAMACGQEDEQILIQPDDVKPNAIQELRSSLPRQQAPDSTQAELDSFHQSQRDFGFTMYGQLAALGQDNIFYSPFSISQALSMLYVGARGKTADEIANALQFKLPAERLHPAWNHLDLELAKRGQQAQGSDGQPFRLKVANSIWGQRGYSFLPEFLDPLAVHYGAGLRALDFQEQPEPSRQLINDWVAQKTEDKIKDLLPQGSIDASTRLVLTNAIYFNAAWAEPFEEAATVDGEFILESEATKMVKMMNQESSFATGVDADGTRVLVMPYDGQELDMVILMPPLGQLSGVESKLGGAAFERYLGVARSKHIKLAMPQFKFETKYSLNEPLKALGMTSAFDDADLSGIDGTKNLVVSGVFHNGFVAVNEKGTEAAAATAVVIRETSVPVVEEEVTINMPFMFVIRDRATNVPLFIGRVKSF